MPRQKTIVVPSPLRAAGVVLGTINRASRARPATAELRSRTATVSVARKAALLYVPPLSVTLTLGVALLIVNVVLSVALV